MKRMYYVVVRVMVAVVLDFLHLFCVRDDPFFGACRNSCTINLPLAYT